ncbi:tyrosine-type recombinase/integrase [Methylobacterium phyllostachyos]|nr:integrase arm-type DNA-binding domain-containing protein [Methylobacterium phyllostachyos]
MWEIELPKSGRHPEKKLTAIGVRNLREPGRYTDGGGLYLVVDPSGAKRWVQRIVVQGRRRDIGLGGAATVSLAEAREKALEIRKSARSGGDPVAERRAAQRHVPAFAEAIDAVHAEHKKSWKNEKHGDQWINTLRAYAVPLLGNIRINRIETADVVQVLAPIWTEKPETARRVRQRLSTVFKWAKANGFRSGENPVEGAELGLAKQTKSKSNFAALPYSKMPEFVASLDKARTGTIPKLAFKFLILTAARSGEVFGARWSEIDYESATWTIPAVRMKAKKEHRVPLGPKALCILREAQVLSAGSDFIFPGTKAGRPLSNMVFTMIRKDFYADFRI